MAHKLIAVVCLQAIIVQLAFGQVIRQFSNPGCGCGCGLLPEQLLSLPIGMPTGLPVNLPTGLPVTLPTGLPVNLQTGLPGCLSGPLSYAPQQLVYEQPTTIIQDSTVANNLANALQLLVVSNLLSSTLPLESAPLVAPLELAAPLPAPLITQRAPCNCGCNGLGPYTVLY